MQPSMLFAIHCMAGTPAGGGFHSTSLLRYGSQLDSVVVLIPFFHVSALIFIFASIKRLFMH